MRFVIFAHPREARNRISTGYLAHLSLPNSVYIRGYDFDESAELMGVLDDENSETYLLFPSLGAVAVSELRVKIGESNRKKVNLLVVESTWAQAQSMLKRSKRVQCLPAVTLETSLTSRFKIRTQPDPGCLSTIEALACVQRHLGELDEEQSEVFLKPFLTLVDRQIEFQKINNPRSCRKG